VAIFAREGDTAVFLSRYAHRADAELELQQRSSNMAFWFIQSGQCGSSLGE
jgi:hypothetical protein